MTMTPSRPYLLRAFYDWLLDNELTPHLVVDANISNVEVPVQYVQDGQIVLNVSPSAVQNFHMDNEALSFSARFGGIPMQVYIPMAAALAIYARENGAGTMFEPEAAYELDEEDFEADFDPLIKEADEPAAQASEVEEAVEEAVEEVPAEPVSRPAKGRPHLTLVK